MENPLLQPFLAIAHQIIRSFTNLRCLTTGLSSGPWRSTLALLRSSLQGALELDAAAVSTVVQPEGGGVHQALGWIFEWMCHYMFF